MKSEMDKWSIVLAGSWNRAIFTPNWMAKYLFEESQESSEKRELKVEVEVPVIPALGALVFTIADLRIQVDSQKAIITPKLCTDKVLRLAETVARRILKTLPHTPLQAFGINFVFVETDPTPEVLPVFEIGDWSRLAEHTGSENKIAVTRSIKLEGHLLNLTITKDGGTVYFQFNFHFELKDASAASGQLENQVLQCRDVALGILEKVYNLHEEVSENNGDENS
jgi:hypothetical protein